MKWFGYKKLQIACYGLLILFQIMCAGQKDKTAEEMDEQSVTVKYFKSWGSYSFPRIPEDPISENEINNHRVYYEARYDAAGQFIRFTKILDGELEWQDEYFYWPDGTIKVCITKKQDGTSNRLEFDSKGNLVKK